MALPLAALADEALRQVRADPALAMLAASTAVFSLTLFSAALGAGWARRTLKALLGASLGAMAGLLTYVVGHVAAMEPRVLGVEELVALALDGLRAGTLAQAFCVALGAGVGLAATRHSWRLHGAATYLALASVVLGYLLHAVAVALPRVPSSSLPFALALFAVEAMSLLLVAAHAFYSLDFSSRKRWRRRPEEAPFSKYHQPKVAFHVATYNEPPDMVVATVKSILALDYPADRLVVMVLDDSTDPASREPVERFCRERGVLYHHRTDRRGFKAGALNEALRLTPPDVDLVAVVDADYLVEPRFLRETVGYFIDPALGFLQTPQDYRNVHQSFLTRQYSCADAYFYRAVLPSRNEENAIIFCGTMGILRRAAVEDAGGWGESFLTEDAELSIRILENGYRSLYVGRTYGRGLIPATFDAYKKQHHRWAYGSVQVVKGHARRLLAGGRLSMRQRADFVMGAVHWFDGLLVLALALLLLGMAAADLAGTPLLTHHAQEVWLLGLVPAFLLFDGVLRLHLALRRTLRVPLSATFGVLGMWMSVKLSNALGALRALLGIRMAFVRTPKAPTGRIGRWKALGLALRIAPVETALALVLLGAATAVSGLAYLAGTLGATRALLSVWLAYYAIVFSTAPLYAYKSFTTCRPLDDAAPAGTGAPAAGMGAEGPAV